MAEVSLKNCPHYLHPGERICVLGISPTLHRPGCLDQPRCSGAMRTDQASQITELPFLPCKMVEILTLHDLGMEKK